MDNWPSIYDAEELASQITEILRRDDLAKDFFSATRPKARICQGDVVSFTSELPLIDENGQPAATDHAFSTWVVIGNTCDFERDLTEVEWSQIVPLVNVGNDRTIDKPLLAELKAYRYARRFYFPDWTGVTPASHFLAEFSMPVTVHKSVLLSAALQARLSRPAWILLHACLIRFLCRDDRRFVA